MAPVDPGAQLEKQPFAQDVAPVDDLEAVVLDRDLVVRLPVDSEPISERGLVGQALEAGKVEAAVLDGSGNEDRPDNTPSSRTLWTTAFTGSAGRNGRDVAVQFRIPPDSFTERRKSAGRNGIKADVLSRFLSPSIPRGPPSNIS